MTEAEAKAWLSARHSPAIVDTLSHYVDLLAAENGRQNLVAPSTIASIWARHIVDSAQLHDFAPDRWKHWVDIGSGAGLPGIVIAILSGGSTTLIEPRRLRAQFLRECAARLALPNVNIVQAKAETAILTAEADVVSARAVAAVEILLRYGVRLATKAATFVLPRGAGAEMELADTRPYWSGTFHVERSVVEPTSLIIVASNVSQR